MCPEHKNLIGGTQPRMPGVTNNKVRQKGLTNFFLLTLLVTTVASLQFQNCMMMVGGFCGWCVCVELRTSALLSSVSFRNIRTADAPKRARACS